jgi:mRNA interferase YafQ
MERRGFSRAALIAVVDVLRSGAELPKARRDQSLQGAWKDWRVCHIQPDWLLIYKATDTDVLLARTGTHAELFGN